MGNLYIVATPIGNLQDITLRALTTLFEVDYIACEDTRRTGNLLHQLSNSLIDQNITKRPMLISYYEQNELQRIPAIIEVLKLGKNVALVSDAGTPTISDPGFKLVREAVKEGIKVESIPGASSVLSALVVSGLPTDKFMFLGFLPEKDGHRKKFLENTLKSNSFLKNTFIFFASPYKIVRNLEDLKEVFGDIEIVVCRELTKIHEEIRREKISDSLKHFQKTKPKGEFVVLFNCGNSKEL